MGDNAGAIVGGALGIILAPVTGGASLLAFPAVSGSIGAVAGHALIDEPRRAQNAAASANDRQVTAQKVLEEQRRADIEAQRSQEESTRTRDAARQRQLALTTGQLGRADTILTSPLGKLGDPNTAGRKILGG